MESLKLNELDREVLAVLENGGAMSNKQLGDVIAEHRGLSEEELAVRTPDGASTVFRYRIRWAKTKLKNAGLIEYLQHGIAQITDEGKRVLKENPPSLNQAFLLKGQEKSLELKEDSQAEKTPLEHMDSNFSEINAELKNEILEAIFSNDSYFFEHLVGRLLMAMGYGDVLVTPRTNDGGIDGICREDKLGFSNIYIQAKRYALDKMISRPDIQGFIGAIANKTGKGLFITTARFSSGAAQCARENHIVLVDGDKLAELMIEHSVGVSTLQTYEIKKLDSDFFMEQE
ncbi:MAG: restriction endonuclease [Oscillospiraceae bacterium]|nr:restriction endonuclease [Oscillospiraceae bacterium]